MAVPQDEHGEPKMSIADKLKKRRREEQEIRGYASSSRWYTGLSNSITFLERAETGEDALGRFGDAWGAAYNLFMMYGEPGDEEFKRFNSWITEVKDHPTVRSFFQRGEANQELASFRSSIERVKGKLLKAQGQQELYAWGTQKSPDKACRYFFSIIRDMRNTVYHPNFNPDIGPVKKALATAADCLVPLAAAAAEALIEKPVAGTTGRTTAYRFFLYPFLKNSDGFFSDYYLERLLPDEELGAFPEDQAREALKFITKQLEAKGAGLKQADSEETLRNWCEPSLFEVLKMKPSPGVRIVSEDAVFEPTLVLRRSGSSALRGEYRGKEAAKDIAALVWILPWRSTLDAVSTDPAFESVPVTEVVHRALVRSDVPWALVTNGHHVRLLNKASAHRPRCFLEADLAAMVDRRGDSQAVRAFRFFLGLFSGPSLTEFDENGKTRLERVAIGSERHGKEIGDELKQNVYSALEELGEGFLDYLHSHPTELDEWRHRKATNLSRERFLASDDLLEDIYHESLSLMYRLLFLFYAESRELLPVDNEVYQTYSLEALRDDVHSVLDDPDPKVFFAKGRTDLWQRLKDLFKFLDKGWNNIIPAYNGGLFDPDKHEFLEHLAVGDHYLAHAVDLLSRTRPRAGQSRGEGRKKVTYRDLDVRHLGSIYEGILEYSAHIADQDYVVMRTGSGSGSAEEYKDVTELSRDERQQLKEWREALTENPDNPRLPRGCKVTGLKETGQYYLVYGGRESKRKSSGSYYTPDYIVQYIVENTLGPLIRGECRPQLEVLSAGVEQQLKKIGVPEGRRRTGALTSDEILQLKVLDPAMGSGHFLVAATEFVARAYREACIREGKTLGEAGAEQEFIRAKRIIAERCIYGVDLNPMAVELAKLSMWLFTMDPGRPLSFLDHHLKCGNAIIGAWVKDLGQLQKFDRSGKPVAAEETGQGNLFDQQFRKNLPLMLKDILGIMRKETLTAEDIKAKKMLDREVEKLKAPFRNVADTWLATFLGEHPGDYLTLLSNPRIAVDRRPAAATQLRFFHWELEFPEVFFSPEGEKHGDAGFNCVVGNPPWASLKGKHGIRSFDERQLNFLFAKVGVNSYMPNLFEAFCLRVTQLLAIRSTFAFVVPDRITANDNYTAARRSLFEAGLNRVEFKVPFPDIIADVVVFVCNRVQQLKVIEVGRWEKSKTQLMKDEILEDEDLVIPFIGESFVGDAWDLMKRSSQSVLSNWFETTSGFGGMSELITTVRQNARQREIRKGADIAAFKLLQPRFFEFIPENLTGRTSSLEILGRNPKVLLRKTGRELIAAYDDSACLPEQSLYFLYDGGSKLHYFSALALLNSLLYTFLYQTRFVTNLESTPQLKKKDLDRFWMPAHFPDEDCARLALELSRKGQQPDLLRELNERVFDLFGIGSSLRKKIETFRPEGNPDAAD
jgi:hypothetical protein